MKKLVVNKKYDEKKLNKFLLDNVPNLTYGLFCNTLRKKDIKINGKRVNKDISVFEGDEILVYISDSLLDSKSSINLNIIFATAGAYAQGAFVRRIPYWRQCRQRRRPADQYGRQREPCGRPHLRPEAGHCSGWNEQGGPRRRSRDRAHPHHSGSLQYDALFEDGQ